MAHRVPLALLLISLSMIAGTWWWLAMPFTPVRSPIDPGAKLDCVSYAPFRKHQSPWNSIIIISPEQIAEDLAQLSRISKCIRTYSVENGLDKVPELASRVGLTVILGVWIGRDRVKNALAIDTAMSVADQYPGVVTAMMVGSEVLLRGEMLASDLLEAIRSVKARSNIPVSYADVWEFWLRHREVADEVDFATIHILPYWEDLPVRAEDAAAHVNDIRKRMALALPGKEILIGETGWPSTGRMRGGAVPSRINQARFVSGILDLARQENFRVNLFEAYDEPWKRRWEGTVGANWGLFDGVTRELKHPTAVAISNYPFWKSQLSAGLALSVSVFGVAFWTQRRRQSPPRLPSWVAVTISATVGGILVGLAVEKVFYESYGFGGWLFRSLLLAAGLAAPLLASNAAMSERALPTFSELIGPRESGTLSFPAIILGFTLLVTALIATESALALVFDPRRRDFPFADLTMAAVPFWTLTLLNRPRSATRPIAEKVFASLFAGSAIYVGYNEGFHNWQALWTAAAYLLLGATLWRARSVSVFETESSKPAVFSEVFEAARKLGALNAIGAGCLDPEPASQAKAVACVRRDDQCRRPGVK
jgi:exo-beta-1,3-glucanase (GH17 family)